MPIREKLRGFEVALRPMYVTMFCTRQGQGDEFREQICIKCCRSGLIFFFKLQNRVAILITLFKNVLANGFCK